MYALVCTPKPLQAPEGEKKGRKGSLTRKASLPGHTPGLRLALLTKGSQAQDAPRQGLVVERQGKGPQFPLPTRPHCLLPGFPTSFLHHPEVSIPALDI